MNCLANIWATSPASELNWKRVSYTSQDLSRLASIWTTSQASKLPPSIWTTLQASELPRSIWATLQASELSSYLANQTFYIWLYSWMDCWDVFTVLSVHVWTRPMIRNLVKYSQHSLGPRSATGIYKRGHFIFGPVVLYVKESSVN